jgi:hypothetical protein
MVEALNYFYVYATGVGSLQPFYRCLLTDGTHLYTRSASCEGAAGARREGALGYIAVSPTCGSTPLYRLYSSASGDHFYTTSAAERDNAIARFGYISEGTPGHVWLTP